MNFTLLSSKLSLLCMNFTSGFPFKNDTHTPIYFPLRLFPSPEPHGDGEGWRWQWHKAGSPSQIPWGYLTLGSSHQDPLQLAWPLPWDTQTEGLWFQSNATSLTRAFFSFFFSKMKANRMIHSLKSTHEKKGSHPGSQFSLL